MNILLENGSIMEMACGSNFSYVLADNSCFSSTEYKVLQSKKDSVFIRCMKMLYNGQFQFYYMTSGYRPFSSMLSILDPDSLLTVSANIFADILEVRSYGFLSCRNIDISFDKIFVDPVTYKVKLIYLPSLKRFFSDESSFENELRTSLVKLIVGNDGLASPRTMKFKADLTNGMYTLEEIYNHLKGRSSDVKTGRNGLHMPEESLNRSGRSGCGMKLVALNAPVRIEILINKERFVIGKKADRVDGVVGFNDKISRVHCCIQKNKNGSFMISDLKSANGTYVNRVRLKPNESMKLNQGDIVRLANSDFQVVME